MIDKKDLRILSLMLEKTDHLLEIITKYPKEEIEHSFILSDSIQYEFEKLYEDITRLSISFKYQYEDKLHISNLRGIRNRVAHDYESVSLTILIDTINEDISLLNQDLRNFVNNEDI